MVSPVSIEATSTILKATTKATALRADPARADSGFGAVLDTVTDTTPTAASQSEPAPVRSAPTPSDQASTNASDRDPSQKTNAADSAEGQTDVPQSDVPANPDAATAAPVVTITLEDAAIVTGIIPPSADVTGSDVSADPGSANVSDPTPDTPVVTGIVAQTAIVPIVTPIVSIAPAVVAVAPAADSVGIGAVGAAKPALPTTSESAVTAAPTGPALSTETTVATTSAPSSSPAAALEESAKSTQTTLPVAADAAAKAEAPVAPPVDANAKADAGQRPEADGVATVKSEITAVPQSKPSATAEQPVVESKPAEKQPESAKSVAKADIKTEGAPQPDHTAAPAVREVRAPQTAATDTRNDTMQPANASNLAASPQHISMQQTQAAAITPQPINASVQLASNLAVPVAGLAVNIAFNANSGRSQFEIRLDPAELGRIDVRLNVDRNGQVTSHLTVERPATLDMLRRDAPQLQRALEDAGLKTSDGGLQFSLRDQSHQQTGSDDKSPRGQAYRLVVDETTALPADAGRSYARLATARGGVDIRI